MRKILFLLFTLLVITGCQKELYREPNNTVTEEGFHTEEKIFAATGCKPKDVKSIKRMWLFEDKTNNKRYLFGSRMKEGKECFWVAKFTAEGSQVWETVKENEKYDSYAINPQFISTGKIVVQNVLSVNTIDLKGSSPAIVNPDNGNTDFIKVFDGYFYTEVHVYDRFFVCTITPEELNKLPNVKEWAVQIRNDGKILSQDKKFTVPKGDTFWPVDSVYICMNPEYIQKGKIFAESPEWTYKVSLPVHKTYKTDLSVQEKEDEVKATYILTSEDAKETTVTYEIFYKTGQNRIKVEGISFEPKEKGLVVEEEYTLAPVFKPENANLTEVRWKSSDTSIATVNEDGTVKAIKKGKCVITVTTKDGSFSANCSIKVTPKEEVNGIYFATPTNSLLASTSLQLNATVTPATALNKAIKWSSSDTNIADVDANGIVTGNAKGLVTITAETVDGGFKATCEVEVKDITEFIDLNYSAQISSYINGYVTGTIFSEITNKSTETIKLTNLTVVDTRTGTVVAMAPQSEMVELSPNSSRNIGGPFTMVYVPMFIWEFEFKGERYRVSHRFLQNSPYSSGLRSKKANGLIWVK